jgi:hypothetical protein
MKISVRLSAVGIPAEPLHAIIAWVKKHFPIGQSLTRVMPTEYVAEVIS